MLKPGSLFKVVCVDGFEVLATKQDGLANFPFLFVRIPDGAVCMYLKSIPSFDSPPPSKEIRMFLYGDKTFTLHDYYWDDWFTPL